MEISKLNSIQQILVLPDTAQNAIGYSQNST